MSRSCAIMVGDTVKCWGDNSYGGLGNGTNTFSSTPVDVVGLSAITELTVSPFGHACALNAQGILKCWGDNGYGQYGDGTSAGSLIPVEIKSIGKISSVSAARGRTLFISTDGRIRESGVMETISNTPVPVTTDP